MRLSLVHMKIPFNLHSLFFLLFWGQMLFVKQLLTECSSFALQK